jgi:uncharacterized protein (DUF2235 family)
MVGTWQDSEEDHYEKKEGKPRPSNVALFSRAINPISKIKKDDGTSVQVEQIVYYQAGIGTSLSHLQRVKAGALGLGLAENVREAYGFICHNWQVGDEYLLMTIFPLTDRIYLFGFSRGAYTARTLGGLITSFGILNKGGMDQIVDVWKAYQKGKDGEADLNKLKRVDNRTSGNNDVHIKCIGVWDTVGSLGIPDLYIFNYNANIINKALNWFEPSYQFNNTDLSPLVENAFHAYYPLR